MIPDCRHCPRGPIEVPHLSTAPPPAALFECRPQEPLVFGLALLGAVATQVVVFAVEGNDRSARWPMVSKGGNAGSLGHGWSDLNPVITGLGDLERPLCLVTDR